MRTESAPSLPSDYLAQIWRPRRFILSSRAEPSQHTIMTYSIRRFVRRWRLLSICPLHSSTGLGREESPGQVAARSAGTSAG